MCLKMEEKGGHVDEEVNAIVMTMWNKLWKYSDHKDDDRDDNKDVKVTTNVSTRA